MSTTLEYNGVELIGVETLDFNQECIYDESGSDLARHRFAITVRGMVHGFPVAPQRTDSSQTQPDGATQFAEVESYLMAPRKSLTFKVGNVTLVEADGSSDVDNGPQPKSLRVINIAGTTVIRIEYTIVASIVKCAEGGGQAILSNRWMAEDDIDDNLYTTRTIRGRIRVRHAERHSPQGFREIVVPPIAPGFYRSRMTFITEPNGLEMAYAIADRSMHAAPPAPATDWKVYDTTATVVGTTYTKHAYVLLTGPPSVNRRDLIGAAIAVMEARVGSLEDLIKRGSNDTTIVPKLISITERFSRDEAAVECQGQFEYVPNNTTRGLGLLEATTGANLAFPGYDPKQAPVPEIYPTGSLPKAFSMYAKDPCSGNFEVDRGKAPPASGGQPDKDSSPSDVKYFKNGQLPAIGSHRPNYSDQHRKNPYQFNEVSTRFAAPANTVALPVAMRLGSSADQATVKAITLFPRVVQQIVRIKSDRVGAWPENPPAEDITRDGIKLKLLDAQFMPHAPELVPGGSQYRYRTELEYVYAMEKPPVLGSPLTIGAVAYDNQSATASAAKYPNKSSDPAGQVV